jgi:hypothetical protein
MLFVWLMALGIGVANACLVQQDVRAREHSGHSHPGIDPAKAAEHMTLDPLATSYIHIDHKDPSSQKLACLDFCEAQQSAAVTDHTDGLADPGLAAVPFLTGLLAPTDHQMSTPEAFGSPTWSEPPVSIRYLRLTI